MMADQRTTSATEKGEEPKTPDVQVYVPKPIKADDDDDRRAHVVKYGKKASFPFEKGETVWIFKPGFRAPLGEFIIVQALPNDMYELANKATNTPHTEHVERQHLKRNPY